MAEGRKAIPSTAERGDQAEGDETVEAQRK
jgi:hypothetical protein